ncbi:adenine-specific methyltransferase EcoRI family protein [Arthrobacter sp. cf158]|uniref:adenine-specific methyltransferase EcoRI family protein n=1 Tax=Arthrobacter sp. cf158 TaxID=1761744 RepID=UPI000B865C5B|nr:adenine-specific methyltransferase EcoRI family protein [Arthrobacter sp. cf158]
MASKQQSLGDAKSAKLDEFYTQLSDIEKELRHYKAHFKDKVVYLNCDDPRESEFFHYFSYNFEKLGLKKLIAACFKSQDVDLFSIGDNERAIYLEYTGDKDGDRIPGRDEIEVKYFDGDGDFRSAESIALLKQADIVVTNPPFSLFREYVAQLMKYDKQFLIIGNMNAVTYKEIWPLIQEDKMWLGVTRTGTGQMWFRVNDDAPVKSGQRTDEEGRRYQTIGNSAWFTNLDHAKRHEELTLFKSYSSADYPTYDNFDAIEVAKTVDIPMDYDGVMGVPITFLGKYSPEQFKIVELSRYTKTQGMSKEFVDAYYASGQTGQISEGHPDLCYYDSNGRPVVPYMRVLIRRKDGSA